MLRKKLNNRYKLYLQYLNIIFIIYFLFLLGNWIYTLQIPLIIRVFISELSFILLYTIIDKAYIFHKQKIIFIIIGTILFLFLPIFNFIFYSIILKYVSLAIFILGTFINYIFMKNFLSIGWTKLFSSQISSILASIIDIILFSFLLEIGAQGIIFMSIARLFYVWIIPKIILR